jgi:hypothetical protein
MNAWAQESPKSELRLRSYKGFKLIGYKKLNRDLYVNFHGLKHNFKKVQGFFCKITSADEFLELMNYFSNENFVGIGPRDSRKQVHGTTLNGGRPFGDLRRGFNTNEGVRRF